MPTLRPGAGISRPKGRVERILLSLKSITDKFPPELQKLLAQPPAASVIVAIGVDSIMDQLATGRVELSIADLRRISPINIFAADTSRDQERVELPLHEIILKLDPSLLKRRAQTSVELPGDIEGVFAKEVEAEKEVQSHVSKLQLLPGVIPGELKVDPTLPIQPIAPIVPAATGESASPGAAVPERTASQPPEPDGQAQDTATFREPEPVTHRPLAAPADMHALFGQGQKEIEPVAETPVVAPVASAPLSLRLHRDPEPILEKAAESPLPSPILQTPEPGERERRSVSLPRRAIIDSAPPPARVKELPAQPTKSFASGKSRTLTVPLAKIDEKWPEAVRDEIAGFEPAAAIEFPISELGSALKTGKVTFQWQQLREWLDPKLSPPVDSPHAAVVLEIPLGVIAPLFMAVAGSATAARRVEVDESIPAPFSIASQPSAGSEIQGTAPAAGPTPGALGLDGSLPSELIDRACALNGVAGAIIALREGLLVAAKVPAELQAETLAAFLPQLFIRLELATGTMQIGELQNLMFTAADRPWQIWKAGPVFFAAMGRPHELLPSAQLKVLATQLARQSKV